MIKMHQGKGNIVEASIKGKIKAEYFRDVAEFADRAIAKHKTIKVLAETSGFEGWEDMGAMQKHFGFIQSHHSKVDKLAVIAGPWWQSFMINFAQFFVHPKVKIFQAGEIDKAREWLEEK